MRLRIALVALPCLCAAAFVPARASATDCSGIASPCIDDDVFWPHAGYARFQAVGSVDTIAAGQVGFGLVTTYLSRPIVLKLASPGGTSVSYAVSNQANGTFLWSYGVAERMELDLALPLTFAQSGVGLAPVGGTGLSSTATRDIRFGFTYALIPGRESTRTNGGGLAARFEVSAPTGDRSDFAAEPSGVFAPSLAGEFRIGQLFAGAELGARLRPVTELLGARVGTQLVTSVGVGVDLLPLDRLTAEVEAWALPGLVAQDKVAVAPGGGFVNQPGGAALVPSEWQLSVRTAAIARGAVSVQLGGGGALPLSGDVPITTPRFRFTLGVRWAPLTASP
jgi:OmpA-OmpF porin, OOP family